MVLYFMKGGIQTVATLSKEEFMNRLQAIVGESDSDESLKLVEDFTDTYNDLESRTTDKENWKQKYEDNDAEWRKKYKERFFSAGEIIEQQEDDVNKDSSSTLTSYNDLFKEREVN